MKPLTRGNSRVFLTAGGACPNRPPLYHSCLIAGKVTVPRPDAESIEEPAQERYGQWEHKDSLQVGTREVSSVDLAGWYALRLKSDLLAIARAQQGKRSGLDVQLHFGECKDPREFYPYDKALILEDAFITDFAVNLPKGTSSRAVNEQVTVKALKLHEVLPLSAGIETLAVEDEFVEVINIPDCCGDAGWYAVSTATCYLYFQSPVTGLWTADQVDSMNIGHDPCGLAKLGDYIVVFSTDSGSMHCALKDGIDLGVSNWFETVSGFTTAPTCCWGVPETVWVGGQGGYIYKVENVVDGAVALEAGTLDTGSISDIHALDSHRALAVGGSGFVAYTTNQKGWRAASRPVGIGVDLGACWMVDAETWFVGDSNGCLWYTLDQGIHWTMKKDFG